MTPRKNKAIAALLRCSTQQKAAREAGISESTMRRYLADPEFQTELRKAYAQMVQDAADDLKKTMRPTIRALFYIAMDNEESSHTRTAAGRALLDYGLRYSEFSDILRQLNEDDVNVL